MPKKDSPWAAGFSLNSPSEKVQKGYNSGWADGIPPWGTVRHTRKAVGQRAWENPSGDKSFYGKLPKNQGSVRQWAGGSSRGGGRGGGYRGGGNPAAGVDNMMNAIESMKNTVNSFRPSVQRAKKEVKQRKKNKDEAARLRAEKQSIIADSKNQLEIQKHKEWLAAHAQAKQFAPKKCGWLRKKLGRC